MRGPNCPKGSNNAKNHRQMKRNSHHKTVKNNHQNDKKECPDEEKVRMFYKDGNSTMLFCRLPRLAAICLEANIIRFLERKNVKLNGKFILK